MKRAISTICLTVLGLTLTAPAVAQEDEDGGDVGRIFVVSIKTGQGEAFREGIKAYMDCYGENGGERDWGVWSAETGDLGRYAFTTFGHNWVTFDEQEAADEACVEVFTQQFLPHVEVAGSEFVRLMPEQSHFKEGDYNLVWAINFDVNDAQRFVRAVSQIAAAAKATEWRSNYAFYDVVAGGPDSGDFFVAVLNGSFAGMGDDDTPLWDMVESHHGKEATDQIRAGLRETVQHEWSEMWSRLPELSYTAGE